MLIDTARNLGLRIRDRRRDLKMSQAALAATAGVSRRWLVALEAGKPTSEIGLVFQTLDALGLVIDVKMEEDLPKGVDLDQLIRGLSGAPDE